MVKIKITGEQPFQVNAHSFSCSPSAEGYTLNYSADGREYTAWSEATPANEVLVCCGHAKGMYFKLVGNNSEVNVCY